MSFHAGKPERNLVYAWEGEVAELKAKNERLRAALRLILDTPGENWSIDHDSYDVHQIALSALNQQTEE